MNKINWSQLLQYQEVFGLKKMSVLWHDFLDCSEQYWQELNTKKTEDVIYIFHNWRSSSKIFGMDGFAGLCQRIENDLQKQKYDIAENVSQLNQIYEANIKEIKQYFIKMEQNNE